MEEAYTSVDAIHQPTGPQHLAAALPQQYTASMEGGYTSADAIQQSASPQQLTAASPQQYRASMEGPYTSVDAIHHRPQHSTPQQLPGDLAQQPVGADRIVDGMAVQRPKTTLEARLERYNLQWRM